LHGLVHAQDEEEDEGDDDERPRQKRNRFIDDIAAVDEDEEEEEDDVRARAQGALAPGTAAVSVPATFIGGVHVVPVCGVRMWTRPERATVLA